MTRQELILSAAAVRRRIIDLGSAPAEDVKEWEECKPGVLVELLRVGSIYRRDDIYYPSPIHEVKERDVPADLSYENES